jgi:hypothetical protein
MAAKKIGFSTTYKPAQPDPPAKEKDPYQPKKPIKRPSSRWLSLSTMTCRDFSKNKYDYRDLNFQTSDSGLVYELPKPLSKLSKPEGKFYNTELRFLNFKPNSTFNSKKSVNVRSTVSSQGALYGSSLYSTDAKANSSGTQGFYSKVMQRTAGANNSKDQSTRLKDSASQTLRSAKCQTEIPYIVEACRVRNSETQTDFLKHVNFHESTENLDVKYRPRSASVIKSSIKSKPQTARSVLSSPIYYSASKDVSIQAFDDTLHADSKEATRASSVIKIREIPDTSLSSPMKA